MKVYISQPYDNKSYVELEMDRAYAINNLQTFNHEVIDDYVRNETSIDRDSAIYQLSDDLKKLSEADAVYFLDGWENSPRCQVERKVCEVYGIKIYDPREYY